jgi:hypothetical protein
MLRRDSVLPLPPRRVSLQPGVQFIWVRFIDDELHLSPVKSVECEFRFEQKNYQIEQNKKSLMRQVVVFGTEILIKHVFSNYYVSFE